MKLFDLQNDILVFDIDGVLARFNFPTFGKKVYDGHDWVTQNIRFDMYSFIEKTNLFDELIASKDSMDIYVLSEAKCSYEQHSKIDFIDREYPNIREDNIIFVGDQKYKIDVLKELRNIYDSVDKTDKRIVMIEDTLEVMVAVENLEDENLRCFLVSDFI